MPSYIQAKTPDDHAAALQFLDATRDARDARMPQLIEWLKMIVPFDDFAFSGVDIDGCRMGQGIYLATSLAPEFRSIYTRERLIEIDPLVRQIQEDQPIARWEAVDAEELAGKDCQKLTRLLNLYDVAPRTGITLWNRGRPYGAAMFTRKRPFTDFELATLQTLVPAVHSALAERVIEAVNQRLGLSKGEVQCLRLVSDGLTSEDIAENTQFTVDTVNTYVKSATKKLGVKNRSHAVSEAIRRKIIG